MAAFMETFRGVAHPWLCDAMGHMSWLEERRQGWADVHLEIEFKKEVKENSLIQISSAVEKVGRTSLTLLHRMTDAETKELLSTMSSVTVYFDLQARQATELPATIRQVAQARLLD